METEGLRVFAQLTGPGDVGTEGTRRRDGRQRLPREQCLQFPEENLHRGPIGNQVVDQQGNVVPLTGGGHAASQQRCLIQRGLTFQQAGPDQACTFLAGIAIDIDPVGLEGKAIAGALVPFLIFLGERRAQRHMASQ